MMNYIHKLMVLAGTLLLAACTANELESTESALPQGGEKLELSVDMPNESDHSRIAFDDDALKLTWEEGDDLYLIGYDAEGIFKGTTSFRITSGAGTASGKFSGYTIAGATQYSIYYHAKHLSVGPDGTVTMDYDHQVQTAATSTQHLKHTLLLSTTDKVSLATLKAGYSPITLTLRNSLIRIDIRKKPILLNQISVLTWITQENETTDHLWRLTLTGDACTAHTLSAYLAFDPATTKLGKGQKMHLYIEGKEKYTVGAESANGKTYEAGKRYHLEVTTENRPNTLHTWTSLSQPANEIWVETVGNNSPATIDTGKGYDAPVKIAGTLLWKYHKTDNTPITTLSTSLFIDNQKITRAILPAQVETIGSSAFFYAYNLQRVEFPATLKTIESQAFCGTGLKEINLPEGLETIGKNALSSCAQLTKANLPASLLSIGGNLFISSGNMSDLTISVSDRLTTIGTDLFYNLMKLTKVTIDTPSAKALQVAKYINYTSNVDLYLHKAWYADTSAAKPKDGVTWNGQTWKSITQLK